MILAPEGNCALTKESAVDTNVEQFDIPDAGQVWRFLALAFGLSWVCWIVAIKLHAREEVLNIGTAGPALAAMLLSRRRVADPLYRPLRRAALFVLAAVGSWLVLCLQFAWRSSSDFTLHLHPWLLGVAAVPAWVISGALSKDTGVRDLLRRLVHRPNRWTLIGLLLLPTILIVPAVMAHLFHLPLVVPHRQGTAALAIAAACVFLLYNVIFVAVLEEPGWRGFLLDRLQQKRSPLVASLMVWLPWALWHLPLDYFRPGGFSPALYVQRRVVFLVPIAIILTWIYNRSGRSVLATVMFHASMNVAPFVLPYYPPGLGLVFVFAGYAIIADRMWRQLPALARGTPQALWRASPLEEAEPRLPS